MNRHFYLASNFFLSCICCHSFFCLEKVDQEADPMIVGREDPGLARDPKAYEFRKSRNLIFYISICVVDV